jgi:endogenous inhibitor of DNA gyrase (YacG/DUF329 family)
MTRQVRCPACSGDSLFAPENPYRPFCSARCKGIDFGAWASESFRLPASPTPEDLLEDTREDNDRNDALPGIRRERG